MPAAEPADAMPPPRNRRGARPAPEVWPGGRRTLTLTLEQVAESLQVSVRKVRMLLRLQLEENAAAAAEKREPRAVGLRGLYISDRLTRVTEEALGDFLRGGRGDKEP